MSFNNKTSILIEAPDDEEIKQRERSSSYT
jgi:hypothetical protein